MDLQITPKTVPSITGNFDQYKAELVKLVDSYKDKPLTEETVAPVKSALRQMRTTLEKVESTSISAYFDTPKKIMKAQFAELYSIIAEGESKVDAVIAEDTRKRNEETTRRLRQYIMSKATQMAVEADVVDYVILEKGYFNKTAKEAETLDSVDRQLETLEKNFASYVRAEKKINKMAQEVGPTFNKARFIYMLSKYGDNNDTAASLAEEEVDRLKEVLPESAKPVPSASASKAPGYIPEVTLSVDFPVYDKKKSKGTDDLSFTFEVPKELKKSFNELLKELKGIGIKSVKL